MTLVLRVDGTPHLQFERLCQSHSHSQSRSLFDSIYDKSKSNEVKVQGNPSFLPIVNHDNCVWLEMSARASALGLIVGVIEILGATALLVVRKLLNI